MDSKYVNLKNYLTKHSLGESDPIYSQTLKSNFNTAVEEYEKMRDILGGRSSAPESGGSTGGKATGGGGAGKG